MQRRNRVRGIPVLLGITLALLLPGTQMTHSQNLTSAPPPDDPLTVQIAQSKESHWNEVFRDFLQWTDTPGTSNASR